MQTGLPGGSSKSAAVGSQGINHPAVLVAFKVHVRAGAPAGISAKGHNVASSDGGAYLAVTADRWQ